MNITFKRKLSKIITTVFLLLTFSCISIIIFAVSPYNPGNISDQTAAKFGIEYKIRLRGITAYDENSCSLATNGFYFTSEPIYVYVGEDGYACTSYEPVLGLKINGKYSSPVILYDNYTFCGQTYKNKEELNAFFAQPDPIYGFKLDQLSNYIQDIINYERQFYGEAIIKIYRGKCVITEVHIGGEKVLELKK